MKEAMNSIWIESMNCIEIFLGQMRTRQVALHTDYGLEVPGSVAYVRKRDDREKGMIVQKSSKEHHDVAVGHD